MKALVTGANGFLGTFIVRRLQREGIAVRALLRPGRTLAATDVETVYGDICNDADVAQAVTGVDWVIHAAARVQTAGKWEEFAEPNIRGTRRVIRAATAAGARRIVHLSSLSVYAVTHDGVTIGDDTAYESESQSRGHYSRSKLAADRIALAEARGGAPVVVLRPGLLYGPGKRPPLARQSVRLRGLQLILARPEYTLPMSYVENVADAVVLAACCDEAVGKAFTLVDENIPQYEYTRLYRSAANEQWRPLYLPVDAVAAAAWLAERALRLARRRSPITYHQVRRATQRAHYDCRRAEQLLGWRPLVSVEDGLQRAFATPAAAPVAAMTPAAATLSS